MEFTLLDLIRAFGISVLTGIGIAVLYEPVRIFHKTEFTKSAHYLVCDVLFMIICAVITYFLCLIMLEGSVRVFVIIGEIVGFSLFYLSIRRVLDKIYAPIINILKKIAAKLLKIARILMYNIKDKIVIAVNLVNNKVSDYVWKKKERKSRSADRARKHTRSKRKKEKVQ